MNVEIPGRPKCLHMRCSSQWVSVSNVGVVVRITCNACGREVSGPLKARIEFFKSKRSGKDMVRCVCDNGQVFLADVKEMEVPAK